MTTQTYPTTTNAALIDLYASTLDAALAEAYRQYVGARNDWKGYQQAVRVELGRLAQRLKVERQYEACMVVQEAAASGRTPDRIGNDWCLYKGDAAGSANAFTFEVEPAVYDLLGGSRSVPQTAGARWYNSPFAALIDVGSALIALHNFEVDLSDDGTNG